VSILELLFSVSQEFRHIFTKAWPKTPDAAEGAQIGLRSLRKI